MLCAEVTTRMSRALSRDSMPDIFPQAEVLLEGRTNEEETALIEATTKYSKDMKRSEGPQKTPNTQI